MYIVHTLPSKSLFQTSSLYDVKLTTLITGGMGGAGRTLILVKRWHFFFGSKRSNFLQKITLGTSWGMSQAKILSVYALPIYNESWNFCLRHSWGRVWWDFLLKKCPRFIRMRVCPASPTPPLVIRVVFKSYRGRQAKTFEGSVCK